MYENTGDFWQYRYFIPGTFPTKPLTVKHSFFVLSARTRVHNHRHLARHSTLSTATFAVMRQTDDRCKTAETPTKRPAPRSPRWGGMGGGDCEVVDKGRDWRLTPALHRGNKHVLFSFLSDTITTRRRKFFKNCIIFFTWKFFHPRFKKNDQFDWTRTFSSTAGSIFFVSWTSHMPNILRIVPSFVETDEQSKGREENRDKAKTTI